MSKSLKWSTLALFALALVVVIGHGVIVPRFIWEARLQAIQNQYPDQTIDAKRVVLALSLNPQLMVSEIAINDPARQEQVKLGLIRLGFDGIDSIRHGRLQLESIALKGLEVQAEKQADCSTLNSGCMAMLPLALAARAWQSTQVINPSFFTPELAMNKIEIEEALFEISNPQAKQQLTSKLEQFKFQVGKADNERHFSLGWRIGIQTPEINNELYLSMNALPRLGPARELELSQLKLDMDGQWGGFPWTGTAEQNLLVLRLSQAGNGEGAPVVKLNGENLRTYLRRDDLPETHQAAFSVQQLEGGLPAQDWTLNKAEWTYTHEDAQAWTFNLNYSASTGLLEVRPETIEGSEGLPANAQMRQLNCDVDDTQSLEGQEYWAWQEGWFRLLDETPLRNASVVLCPVSKSDF